MRPTFFFVALLLTVPPFAAIPSARAEAPTAPFRLGVIGTTTSHVPAFINLLNAEQPKEKLRHFRVTAAYVGGMPDNESSWGRREMFRDQAVEKGVVIVPTIEKLLDQVDGVLLMSVDGRCHLEQARPVIAARKPLYIDKPLAGSLVDALEIFRMARENDVPVFSCSALRFAPEAQAARAGKSAAGDVLGYTTWSPCSTHPTHPTLLWYGIHGVESLFTVMRAGCVSVQATRSPAEDVVTGRWNDGRIGVFRGLRTPMKNGYGGTVYGPKGIAQIKTYDGYEPLLEAICAFFKTGEPPVESAETLEMFAFMEAADESIVRNGTSVTLLEVMKAAEAKKIVTIPLTLTANGSLQWDGRPIERGQLADKLTERAKSAPDTALRIILTAEAATDPGVIQEVCHAFGPAVLARFILLEKPVE